MKAIEITALQSFQTLVCTVLIAMLNALIFPYLRCVWTRALVCAFFFFVGVETIFHSKDNTRSVSQNARGTFLFQFARNDKLNLLICLKSEIDVTTDRLTQRQMHFPKKKPSKFHFPLFKHVSIYSRCYSNNGIDVPSRCEHFVVAFTRSGWFWRWRRWWRPQSLMDFRPLLNSHGICLSKAFFILTVKINEFQLNSLHLAKKCWLRLNHHKAKPNKSIQIYLWKVLIQTSHLNVVYLLVLVNSACAQEMHAKFQKTILMSCAFDNKKVVWNKRQQTK